MTQSLAILAAWMVAGQLAGSIPFGWLIGKARGVDIREHGSRNIGATNCGRVCGWPFGVAAFVLDVLKGFAPVMAAVVWLPEQVRFADEQRRWLAMVLVAAQPVLGHLFPVWLRFRGGKAVATSLGVLLALPMLRWVAVAALLVWCLAVLATNYVSVASTVAALALVGMYLWFERAGAWTEYLPITVFVLLVAVLVIVRHKSNYVRLWKGTENRVWSKESDGAAPGG